ncbi:MAG: sensor histidine kinase, partial [Nitrososphaera sp.]
EEYVGATVLEEAKPVTQTIHSNVKGMVEQHQYLFETLWARAIPADRRIREIEEDRPPEFLKIINDYHEAAQVYLNLSRTVKKEALLVLPESKALRREYDLGVLQQLARASNESGALIRIICPLDDTNSEIVQWLANTAPRIQILNGEHSKSTVIVVDNERLFRAELKESGKEEQTDFASSIGFSVYANSRPSVDSFRTFFELLWSAISMGEQLKKAHMLQKEFINIAAHELRSPIQPILGYAELLEYSHTPEQKEGVQGIIRNALRLQKLTDDMLDVARIENNSLKLDKKRFDLDELVATASSDARKQLDSESVKLLYYPAGQVLVSADRYRIAQVIFNLLS